MHATQPILAPRALLSDTHTHTRYSRATPPPGFGPLLLFIRTPRGFLYPLSMAFGRSCSMTSFYLWKRKATTFRHWPIFLPIRPRLWPRKGVPAFGRFRLDQARPKLMANAVFPFSPRILHDPSTSVWITSRPTRARLVSGFFSFFFLLRFVWVSTVHTPVQTIMA